MGDKIVAIIDVDGNVTRSAMCSEELWPRLSEHLFLEEMTKYWDRLGITDDADNDIWLLKSIIDGTLGNERLCEAIGDWDSHMVTIDTDRVFGIDRTPASGPMPIIAEGAVRERAERMLEMVTKANEEKRIAEDLDLESKRCPTCGRKI